MTQYKYAWTIMGQYRKEEPEEVDRARDRDEANYLVGEYRLAFGQHWRIWKRRCTEDEK
jgi:hypothetical protein